MIDGRYLQCTVPLSVQFRLTQVDLYTSNKMIVCDLVYLGLRGQGVDDCERHVQYIETVRQRQQQCTVVIHAFQ